MPVEVIGFGTAARPLPAVTEVTPLKVGVAHDWSPRRKVVLLAVPDPKRAVAIVPVVIFAASRLGIVPADNVIVLLASEIVLLVSVSVVALPTRVSVAVGKVNVPVLDIEEMTGVVKVLFVKVCVPVKVTKPLLFRTVAEMLPVLIASPVIELVESSVLFDKVSAVALPTNVSVAVGKVNVPVLEIVEMTGVVKVLLVSV